MSNLLQQIDKEKSTPKKVELIKDLLSNYEDDLTSHQKKVYKSYLKIFN